MVYSLLTVEFALNYNHVAGVLAGQGTASPGQLLPLLVGLFSLIRLLWIMYRERFIEQRDEPRPQPEKTYGSRSIRNSSWGQLAYGLVTGWLPWLNCFESWRRLGGRDRSSWRSFQKLDQQDENDTTNLRPLHLDRAGQQ